MGVVVVVAGVQTPVAQEVQAVLVTLRQHRQVKVTTVGMDWQPSLMGVAAVVGLVLLVETQYQVAMVALVETELHLQLAARP
jgi:hypothetical protein